MVVVIGADVHKETHTLVAVDEVGREIGQKTVRARRDGHLAALTWARRGFAGREVVWAIEDCRHLSGALERDLLGAGQQVVRVAPKLMGAARRAGRERGKSDPIDARAVARAAQAHEDLPLAAHDETSRALKLLVDRREDLVGQRTAAMNRLRWHLHELDPGLAPDKQSLDRIVVQDRLCDQLTVLAATSLVAEMALEVLEDIARDSARIRHLESRITALVADVAPLLLELPGCGALTAAKIVGETAGISRFRSDACYAMFAGTAPIPVWSGNTAGRVRLNRGGNRQMNAAIHRIAITQVRLGGPAAEFLERKLASGKTKTEAYRSLKRHLTRTIYQILTTQHATIGTCIPAAA